MIKLSAHAIEAMSVREIKVSWIAEVLEQPDFTNRDPRDPSITRSYRAISDAGERILRVVHRSDGADIVVVTVFFDRGAKP